MERDPFWATKKPEGQNLPESLQDSLAEAQRQIGEAMAAGDKKKAAAMTSVRWFLHRYWELCEREGKYI